MADDIWGDSLAIDYGDSSPLYSNTGMNGGSSGGIGWGDAIAAGGDLLGGYFDYKSGKDAAEEMAEAYGQIAADAKQDAQTASGMADPFAAYRPGAAAQLSGI